MTVWFNYKPVGHMRSADRTYIELYSCISFESRQFFKRIFYLKQGNVIMWRPLRAEGPGQLPPLSPSLNPALRNIEATLKKLAGLNRILHCLSLMISLQV